MKPKIRETYVESVEDISPHMRRLTLSGPDLVDFPEGKESAHVKVIVPEPDGADPGFWAGLRLKKRMRSYTVRNFDARALRMTIDFAVNDHRGIAADWALTAKSGDRLRIAGPGKVKHTNFDAPWHLLLGDLTALPALAATLEKLPEDAYGHVILEVPTSDDKQQLTVPKNMTLSWIINDDHSQNQLLEHLKSVEWLLGSPSIFVAGEASQVVDIRSYLKQMPNFRKDNLYASGYWADSSK